MHNDYKDGRHVRLLPIKKNAMINYFVLWYALVKYLDYTMSHMHVYIICFSFAVSLHAENDMPQFRGVLIQARMMADDNVRLGTFAVSPDSAMTTRLSSCPTDTVSY